MTSNTTVSDQYAMAVIQGCLASTPNAALALAQPAALAAFVDGVVKITTACLKKRDEVSQLSAGGGG